MTASGAAPDTADPDVADTAANGLASALARDVVSVIGEEGRAANGAMFPVAFTSACASSMPCGMRADAM
ncbi:hypothetical protein CEQ23_40100 [Burkholderia cepacia]|nr:hypothetical protein CEQ23_40100 [Burkholderia cepacia]